MAHKQALIVKLVEAEKATRAEFEEIWELEPDNDADPDEDGFSIVDYSEEPNLEGFDDGAVLFMDAEKFADNAVRLDKLPCTLAMFLAMKFGVSISTPDWIEKDNTVKFNFKTKELEVYLHGAKEPKYAWSPTAKDLLREDFLVVEKEIL